MASNTTGMEIGSSEIEKNPSLICAPVMADSIDKMVTEACKAQELGADLVEIRLDSLKDFNPLEDLETIINKSPLPTLFTYRFVCSSLRPFLPACVKFFFFLYALEKHTYCYRIGYNTVWSEFVM